MLLYEWGVIGGIFAQTFGEKLYSRGEGGYIYQNVNVYVRDNHDTKS